MARVGADREAIIYCPYCGRKKIRAVGVSGAGTIFKCLPCGLKFVVSGGEED